MNPFIPTEAELRNIYATVAKAADPATLAGRKEMLRRMRQSSEIFYSFAVMTGVHTLIEFTGLINEFIHLCADAEEEGIDWPHASTHTGVRLPLRKHHMQYLEEKLQCIYDDHLRLVTGLAMTNHIERIRAYAVGLGESEEAIVRRLDQAMPSLLEGGCPPEQQGGH